LTLPTMRCCSASRRAAATCSGPWPPSSRAEESGELFGRAIGLAKEGRLRGLRVSLGGRAARDLPLPKGYKGAVIAELVAGVLSQLKVGLVEGEPEEPAESEAEDEQGAEE